MPKNVQDFYKMCPAPRPVIPENNNQVETPSSECASPLGGYMAMNTPGNITFKDKFHTSTYTNLQIMSDSFGIYSSKHTKRRTQRTLQKFHIQGPATDDPD